MSCILLLLLLFFFFFSVALGTSFPRALEINEKYNIIIIIIEIHVYMINEICKYFAAMVVRRVF